MSDNRRLGLEIADSLVLEAVTPTPESATAIWRRAGEWPDHKTLTGSRRRQRRRVAQALERLAEQGVVSCTREPGRAPLFYRAQA